MANRILVTGGAGFIGSHLVDELLGAGYTVRVMDNLTEQVHGPDAGWPDYLNKEAETVFGDIRSRDDIKKALKDVSSVIHLAAEVGVGQSMYRVRRYTDVNNLGTANLMQEIIEQPVEKVVVASSMSIYGEGLYQADNGYLYHDARRSFDQLRAGRWEVEDDSGNILAPFPTTEEKKPSLASVYALSKYDQERMCLMLGEAYNIPVVALRFFNVYGTRQSISNPYTGVLAIFASRYLNDKPPLIFEDGLQKRDFVSVHDVVTACRLALESQTALSHVVNIGSGRCYTITEIAGRIAQILGKAELEPEITGKCRIGDIRHCYSDITLAKELLGYEPKVTIEEGLNGLSGWLEGQISRDRVEEAAGELMARGLAI